MARIISPYNTSFPQQIFISDPAVPFIAPYPDLRRPAGNVLKLNVQLSSSDGLPIKVLVEVLQNQNSIGKGLVVIASKKVTLTGTPTDYEIPITDPEKVVMGRCNLSLLEVRVTPPTRACCPLPTDVLKGTISGQYGTCATAPSSVTATYQSMWDDWRYFGSSGSGIGYIGITCPFGSPSATIGQTEPGCNAIINSTFSCNPFELSATYYTTVDSGRPPGGFDIIWTL